MKNLISLVTGGTSGVGKSVALALAAQGSQVIVAGRDLIKTNAVCEHITRATKNKSVFPMIADLSSSIYKLFFSFSDMFLSLIHI